jgi:hypothetical protein
MLLQRNSYRPFLLLIGKTNRHRRPNVGEKQGIIPGGFQYHHSSHRILFLCLRHFLYLQLLPCWLITYPMWKWEAFSIFKWMVDLFWVVPTWVVFSTHFTSCIIEEYVRLFSPLLCLKRRMLCESAWRYSTLDILFISSHLVSAILQEEECYYLLLHMYKEETWFLKQAGVQLPRKQSPFFLTARIWSSTELCA